MRAGLILSLLVLLAGCQTAGPRPGGADPLTGEAIETTALEDPVVGLAEEQAADNPEPAAPPPVADGGVTEPAPDAEGAADITGDDPATAAEAPPTDAAPTVVDPALQTPEALACIRRGGLWSRVGAGEGRSCVRPTRDAGKRCDADRDCQGVCLARSGTCAPVDPLFGCNDVLQDDGRRMTLCLD
ncbi:MAG: hypothetical protein MUD11_00310 [Rhodobacteraceae bacterium]|jgi:hypothetical protein|nr:hypothetical protein [Paracoccaceae bacterium]